MFHALGDASRRAMVERLSRGPASVSELARPFDMALPTVVQHLGVLERPGSSRRPRSGRVRTYQLVPGALAPAADWIGRQRLPAERRLDRLGAFLDRPPPPPRRNDMNDTIERSQTHATFVIERTYPVPVEAVWHALSDNDARDQWFGAGAAFDTEKVARVPRRRHGTEEGSGTAARGRGSSPPTPTSSTGGGSCSPTTCGSTGGTCPRP